MYIVLLMIFGVFLLNLSEITICSNSLNIWSKRRSLLKKGRIGTAMFQHSNQHQTLVCDNLFTTKNTIFENYKLLQKKQKKETDVSYRLHLTINHKCQLQPEAMELIDLKAFISYGYWLLTIIVIIIIISPLTLVNCARSQERETL